MTQIKSHTPKLRFKEFSGDWEEKKLGNIFQINAGGDIDSNHVSKIKTDIFRYPIFANSDKKKGLYGYSDIYKIDGKTITVTGRGNLGVAISRKDLYYPIVRLLVLKPKIESDNYFFENCINNIKFFIESTGVPQLTGPQISNYKIKFPQLLEQQKIAAFLLSVDEKIENIIEKKKALEEYKKGVRQKIFKQEIKFKDENGEEFGEWEDRKFKNILFEHGEKSSGKELVHSVSVHKGVINQIEHLGRVFAAQNTENYNLVKSGDVIYTKSPTGDFPYGIIKQNHLKERVIISPLYGVFTPETKALGYILHTYFLSSKNTYNYLHSIVQKGAKNTMNITNKTFLSKSLFLPMSKNEQQKIADFLSSIDEKIEKIGEELVKVEEFKRGLVQGMFV